jgi:hypothetical protein
MCGLIAALFAILFGGIGWFTLVPTTVEPVIQPPVVEATAPLVDGYSISSEAALTGGTAIFEESMWRLQTGSSDLKTTYTWLSDSLGAVVYVEYLVYPRGLATEDIDTTFNADWLDTTLSPYQPFEQRATCVWDDVRLYEYGGTIKSNETDYDIRYWIDPINPHYVVTVFMAFPVDDEGQSLDFYAGQMYPALAACAAGN